MGIYLVIKNNIKRGIQNKTNIALIIILPVILCLLTVITLQVKNNTVRIGIIKGESTTQVDIKRITNVLQEYPFVDVEVAKSSLKNTNQIMSRYHMYIDLSNQTEDDLSKVVNKLDTIQQSKIQMNDLGVLHSETRQSVSLLITAFIIVATIHASIYIRDKKSYLVERYRISGHRRVAYFLGYSIYTWIIVVFQSVISLGLIQCILPETRTPILTFVKVIVTMAFVAAIFASVITKVSKNELQANLCSSSIAILLSLMAGTFVSTSNMPELIQHLQSWNPINWILNLV